MFECASDNDDIPLPSSFFRLCIIFVHKYRLQPDKPEDVISCGSLAVLTFVPFFAYFTLLFQCLHPVSVVVTYLVVKCCNVNDLNSPSRAF